MKKYKKIPIKRISCIEKYMEEKLRKGYIIIQLLVNENTSEISELFSYANDKECKSYYGYIADSREQLRDYVIVYELEPFYIFHKQASHNFFYSYDRNNIISFNTYIDEINGMKKNFQGDSFFNKELNQYFHFEFYITKQKGDIENFGNSLELDFISEWIAKKKQTFLDLDYELLNT